MTRGQVTRSIFFPVCLILWLLAGCVSTVPFDYPRTPSSALYRPEGTRLGQRIEPLVVQHGGASGFYLLPNGVDAFVVRARLIDRAEKTLDLQYYIFQTDLTGKFLLDRLVAAAERGVRVRLLLDDFPQTAAMDRWLAMIGLHPNIQVRVFNPFGGLRSNLLSRTVQGLFGPPRLKGRMHNKAFIVDNTVVVVGGRNVADEYFEASTDINFRDIDLLALGPVAREASAHFDDYWNRRAGTWPGTGNPCKLRHMAR
jgi:cardiolipin synthase C